MTNEEILAYNVSNACKNALYGNRYKSGWDEMRMRLMTFRALADDDNIGELTSTEREYLDATLNEPYNN